MYKTIIDQIKDQIQETKSFKDYVTEIQEYPDTGEITLVVKPMTNALAIRELTNILSHNSCDQLSTHNDNLVIRLF